MTIAAIASSPDAENLARSEASVEPVNFFARDKTILELSRSRQRGEEGGKQKGPTDEFRVARESVPPFTKKASSKRDRLLIAFSFLLLFFPSSDPKLNPLLCPFSGEEVAHESSFFSFFFISGPRSVVERKGVVGNYDHDGFAFDG